jgi:tetratricopeptide (TPR) repeat protein
VTLALWGGRAESAPVAPPPPSAQSPRIEDLIRQLGDRDYFKRQKAQTELAKRGFDAFDALNDATTSDDLEIAARAKYLLRLIRVEWTKDNDPADVKRQLRDYEYQTSAERLTRMQALASIPDARGVPALCRLVRFEQSEVLSKHAAGQILALDRYSGAPRPAVAAMIRENLGNSRRAASRWLATVIDFHEHPGPALAEWSKLIDAEQQLLRRLPSQTEPQLVASLLRIKINWLQKQRRIAEAVACMQQLIDLERGDLRTLVDQVEWLVEQKAWKLVDEVAQRFSRQFAGHPILLYAIAESQAARGDTKAAEETAQRALNLYPGRLDQSITQHLKVATHLMRRGRHAWAEREYRGVIQRAGVKQQLGILAHYGLAEMLHDQGQTRQAAETLQAVIQATGKDAANDDEIAGRTVGEIRARMHYFFACDHQQRGDRTKQRAELDQALAADPAEVDTLIACYRLQGMPEEYHKKIVGLIRKAADDLREQISSEPDDPNGYNQYAWLVGNTEGDYDEALRFSKTSLELSPDTGGFYDTLARVYYAKKDYAQAVQSQAKAHELDPHSGQIARQLEFFRRAAAEHAKPKP